MARTVIYGCPGNGDHPPHQFRYCHIPSVEQDPLPRYCGICGYDSQADAGTDNFSAMPSAPHIAKSIGKAGDMTYRQMEWQSEERIRAAAEMSGAPESDFADMKITDMKDNLREGDIAAVAPPPSEVSKLMDAKPADFGFAGAQAVRDATMGRSYIPGQEPKGIERVASNIMAENVNQFHHRNHRGMNAAAQIAKTYTGA